MSRVDSACGTRGGDDALGDQPGAVGQVRALAGGGLATALLDLANSVGAEADVRIDCDVDGDLAVVAWFAASEAVANALKHAGPARIWLSAATEGTYLRVEVADDGAGGADPDGVGACAGSVSAWRGTGPGYV